MIKIEDLRAPAEAAEYLVGQLVVTDLSHHRSELLGQRCSHYVPIRAKPHLAAQLWIVWLSYERLPPFGLAPESARPNVRYRVVNGSSAFGSVRRDSCRSGRIRTAADMQLQI